MIACFENTCPDCGHVHSCGCEGSKTPTANRGLCPECRKRKVNGDNGDSHHERKVHAPRIRFPGEELYLE